MSFPPTHRYGRSRASRLGLLLLALVCAEALAATPIYRCTDRNLGILYTDEPCRNGERMDIRAGDADPAALAWLARERDALDRSSAQRISDERRATLQRQYAAQPLYLADEAVASYADGAEYIPYGYGVMPYAQVARPRAAGMRRDRGSRGQHVVPVPPHAVPRQ